ncbi:VOC family protein [Methylocystis parvus]|uniref:VOC family protein n=1 Tax=Methylocystis parvus TaxID=134 RepID=A0A6B8M9I4_9HYPH|nr:VOC family protein [Methylocystis parvus]QGM98482.1 VOC family protein [Methylocystis parvus]WBK01181.1 VOC family protein [Methylocystis parvus OBBP]
MSETAQRVMPTLTPHIVCAGAAEAMEFYKKAFGATEIMRMPGPDGKLMHGSMRIGDSMLMLVDEMPQWGALGPKARNGTSVTLHLKVPNVDALFAQAVAAGATVKMPVADMFWGDRYGVVVDPFGHEWSIATTVRELTVDEIRAAGEAAFAKGCPEA